MSTGSEVLDFTTLTAQGKQFHFHSSAKFPKNIKGLKMQFLLIIFGQGYDYNLKCMVHHVQNLPTQS